MRFDKSTLQLSAGPTDEPISLDEAKDHLRVLHNEEDSYIHGLIVVARQYAENATRRALLTQTWIQYYDATMFPVAPRAFFLKKPPLQSITSIKYIDTDGVEQTVTSTVYEVDTTSEPARVYLAYDEEWPSDVRSQRKSIWLTTVTGYGAPEDVPTPIIQAMKILIAHLYENREPVVFNQVPHDVPITIDALLEPYVIRWEFA